ncbi:MAG: HAD hydrolase family protein, partial [Spirochaetota bacterium]|nr:HAD hydrolase family protein [Spirochaetota bacterium]
YKFSSGTATKEHSIKVLSEKLNICLNEIISFGDDFNDMGMLKLCGKGIAMQNAIPQVKEIADEITLSNNEDGVARYLEKLLNC